MWNMLQMSSHIHCHRSMWSQRWVARGRSLATPIVYIVPFVFSLFDKNLSCVSAWKVQTKSLSKNLSPSKVSSNSPKLSSCTTPALWSNSRVWYADRYLWIDKQTLNAVSRPFSNTFYEKHLTRKALKWTRLRERLHGNAIQNGFEFLTSCNVCRLPFPCKRSCFHWSFNMLDRRQDHRVYQAV